MGISTGIQDDSVVVEAHFVYLVYQFPFHIALVIVQLDVSISAPQVLQIILERCGSIHTRFALAQQIQIGTIDDLYLHFLTL